MSNDLPESVLNWSTSDISTWLCRIGFNEFADTFIENHVTGEVLLDMTVDHFKELGISSLGKRIVLMKYIAALVTNARPEEETSRNRSLSDMHNRGSDIGSLLDDIDKNVLNCRRVSFEGNKPDNLKIASRNIVDRSKLGIIVGKEPMSEEPMSPNIDMDSNPSFTLPEALRRSQIALSICVEKIKENPRLSVHLYGGEEYASSSTQNIGDVNDVGEKDDDDDVYEIGDESDCADDDNLISENPNLKPLVESLRISTQEGDSIGANAAIYCLTRMGKNALPNADTTGISESEYSTIPSSVQNPHEVLYAEVDLNTSSDCSTGMSNPATSYSMVRKAKACDRGALPTEGSQEHVMHGTEEYLNVYASMLKDQSSSVNDDQSDRSSEPLYAPISKKSISSSSDSSSIYAKVKYSKPVSDQRITTVTADYNANNSDELSVRIGDILFLLPTRSHVSPGLCRVKKIPVAGIPGTSAELDEGLVPLAILDEGSTAEIKLQELLKNKIFPEQIHAQVTVTKKGKLLFDKPANMLENVSHQGYLFLQNKNVHLLRRSYKRRWCVLSNFDLYCYKTPDDLQAIEMIQLPGYSVKLISESKGTFVLTHPLTRSSFIILCNSKTDMDQWMYVISLATVFEKSNELMVKSDEYAESLNFPKRKATSWSSDAKDHKVVLDNVEESKSFLKSMSSLLTRVMKKEGSESSTPRSSQDNYSGQYASDND